LKGALSRCKLGSPIPNLAWLRPAWGPAADHFLIRGAPSDTGTPLKTLPDRGAESAGDPTQAHRVPIDARSPKFDGGILTRLDCVTPVTRCRRHAAGSEGAAPSSRQREIRAGRLLSAHRDRGADWVVKPAAIFGCQTRGINYLYRKLEIPMNADRSKAGEAACRLCGKSGPQMLPAVLVRAPIVEEIKKQHPDWQAEGYICQADLNRFRLAYIQDLLES